jgi:LPXTG-motif cell wall-anchored protein
MYAKSGWTRLWLVLVATGMTLAPGISAQVQTETSTTTGQSTHKVDVERAEVVYVSGRDVVVKMEDGTIRHISNVPESTKVTLADGTQVGIHDLKPGMKLEKTVTTTTTPKLVTTTQNVTGTVWHANPPLNVILTLDDGTQQRFNIPEGQKFNVDGKMVDAWHLKKGMKVTATKVVEEPVTEMAVKQELTGTLPPPPPADQPILVVVARPPAPHAEAAAQTAAAPAQQELPKTGSELPLFALLGGLAVGTSLALKTPRKHA